MTSSNFVHWEKTTVLLVESCAWVALRIFIRALILVDGVGPDAESFENWLSSGGSSTAGNSRICESFSAARHSGHDSFSAIADKMQSLQNTAILVLELVSIRNRTYRACNM